MNTPTEEASQDGKQRRKSIGTPGSSYRGSSGGGSGGKTRRYSFGIPSSQKSIGEEGKIVPNYLRASTGSCHDFCKYGKRYEHSKSAVPITFKRTTVVNKEKVARIVVPLETKKTKLVTKLKPFTDPKIHAPVEPFEVTEQDVSLPSKKTQVSKRAQNATVNELKTPRRSTSHVKPSPVVVNPSSSVPNSSGSNGGIKKKDTKTAKKTGMTPTVAAPKIVVSMATPSLKPLKHGNLKQVFPLKDQNRMQKNDLKKPVNDKVRVKSLHGVEAESEAKSQTMEFEFICPTIEIIQSPTPPSMELINDPVSTGSPSSSDKHVLEEESTTIIHPVKELLEQSSIAPPVSESSQSYYDEEVEEDLEEEFEYTDDEEVESSCDQEVSEEEFESVVISSTNNDEMGTSVGDQSKFRRKGRVVISQDKDDEAVKLRFRRGKILDLQSENNSPRRLKFRKGKVIDGHEHKQHISRRTFEKKHVIEPDNSNHGPESVVLKHQGEQGKKDAQILFNNVIEETASKLVESRKSKVKALVGAFETVISLQDGKPSST